MSSNSTEAQLGLTTPQPALGDGQRSSNSCTLLLHLPDTIQREVLSSCPDAATANALLSTCRELRRLRSDPTAVALLLLRCNIGDHELALNACSACQGGVCAVVHQVLQLVQAGPDSSGPHLAPPLLLHHMLVASASEGDEATVRALLALPDPPSVNRGYGAAFLLALNNGPHLSVLSALLECGADPISYPGRIISLAARLPTQAPALALLLRHYKAALDEGSHEVVTNVGLAMRDAITLGNLEAVAVLLPAMTAAGLHLGSYVVQVAHLSRCSVLRLLLSCNNVSIQASLPDALMTAVTAGHHACATLLLEHGVDANAASVAAGFGLPLLAAVRAAMSANAAFSRRHMVGLLRHHGAVVTPAVQAVAVAATQNAGQAAAVADATLRQCCAVSSMLQPDTATEGVVAGGCSKCVIA